MYVVRILYPRTEGSRFNLQHYLDIHTPLGLGLLRSTTGVVPLKVEVDADPTQAGPSPIPFHCATSLYFKTEEDVAAFNSLSEHEDVAKQLSADFALYTTNPPVVSVARVISVDPASHRPLDGTSAH